MRIGEINTVTILNMIIAETNSGFKSPSSAPVKATANVVDNCGRDEEPIRLLCKEVYPLTFPAIHPLKNLEDSDPITITPVTIKTLAVVKKTLISIFAPRTTKNVGIKIP